MGEGRGRMRMQAYACCGVPVEVRKQLLGVYFLLSLWDPGTKGRLSGFCSKHFRLPCLVVLGDGRDQAQPFDG